jgi:hypothetical protein
MSSAEMGEVAHQMNEPDPEMNIMWGVSDRNLLQGY